LGSGNGFMRPYNGGQKVGRKKRGGGKGERGAKKKNLPDDGGVLSGASARFPYKQIRGKNNLGQKKETVGMGKRKVLEKEPAPR